MVAFALALVFYEISEFLSAGIQIPAGSWCLVGAIGQVPGSRTELLVSEVVP